MDELRKFDPKSDPFDPRIHGWSNWRLKDGRWLHYPGVGEDPDAMVQEWENEGFKWTIICTSPGEVKSAIDDDHWCSPAYFGRPCSHELTCQILLVNRPEICR